MWDVQSGDPVGAPWLASGGDGVICSSLAFSPDGKKLATGNYGGVVMLWDVATARPNSRLARHTDPVSGVAFSPDGRLLASSSFDGTVIFWDAATGRQVGEPLRGHTGPVNAVAFSPDGKTLVSVGDDRRVMRWDVDLVSWTEQACAIANRPLTPEEWRQILPNRAYRVTCPAVKSTQP